MKHYFPAPTLIMGAVCALFALTAAPQSARASWQLVWSDEFNGTSVDTTKWVFETGNNNGWGNGEREYYTSRTNNAYVAGGLLHIVAKQESFGGFPYTSARMKTQGLFTKKYGRIEFRAKLPQGLGFWPANWMMGTNITTVGWPACGEIDVMENNGSWANQVQGTLHYSDASNNHLQQTKLYTLPTAGDSVTNFHLYAVEWTTNSIKWTVDAVTVQTWTSWSSSTGPYPAPYNQPFFLIMNMAVGGQYLGSPSDTQINSGTVFPGELQVDYVRVYDSVATPPDAPTGLTGAAGTTNAYLNWDASTSGATGYVVMRAGSSGGSYTNIGTTATNSFTDTGLSSCSTYYYMVAATNSVGSSTNSSEAAVALGAFALAVNSGGGTAAQFGPDANFAGGTQAAPVTTAIDTTGSLAPAPQAVYQTERYGSFTYTFTGLIPATSYKIRLHFAETYWTAVGQRRFNVLINGTQVLTSFDIIATAGAANKATIQEFTIPANGSGQIAIQFVTVTDNAKVNGIEILLPRTFAPTALTATPGNAQVNLSWNAVTPAATYNLKRSLANGGPYSLRLGGTTGTNYTDPGLTNGTTYYYVVSAVSAGCESTNSSQASATPACTTPPAPIAGNNGPISAGMTLSLTASTVVGGVYNWSGPNGFTSTSQNPLIASANTNAAGIYAVTASVGGCLSPTGTTSVIVNPPVTVSIQGAGGNVTISWPSGTLQSATNITGPWLDLIGTNSPCSAAVTGPQQFYRVKLQ